MFARAVVLACLGALFLGACEGAEHRRSVDTAKIVDAIKIDEIHWNADYKSGDAARVAAHYAPDAVAMNAGYPATVGVAAITKLNEQAFTDAKYALTFSSDRVEVAASGDLAVSHGSYKVTTTDPKTGQPVTATGSYVTVYKPDAAGVWKAVWDINAPSAAAPAAEAAAP
jgi:ketosteroid isomerase-like protein